MPETRLPPQFHLMHRHLREIHGFDGFEVEIEGQQDWIDPLHGFTTFSELEAFHNHDHNQRLTEMVHNHWDLSGGQ